MSKSLQIIFSVVAALALILSGIGLFQTEPLISPMSGAVAGETNFTQLGIGFDEAVDYQLTFYGNAQDYYFGLDDSVDDLLIGLGSVMGTTPAFGVDENLAITTYGDLTFGGTTPVLTIGDAGAEDAAIVYDGAAQDYYIALDDGTDDLLVGLGSAVGTTPAFGIDENLVTTWSGGTLVLNEIVSAANVLGADECGKTMFLNNAAGFASTLPAASTVSAGCSFTFIVATAPITAAYTIISANTLENVLYGGINELEVDTNDDGPTVQGGDTITLVQNLAVIGDYVYLISDGTFYYFWGQTAADGGSTAAGS